MAKSELEQLSLCKSLIVQCSIPKAIEILRRVAGDLPLADLQARIEGYALLYAQYSHAPVETLSTQALTSPMYYLCAELYRVCQEVRRYILTHTQPSNDHYYQEVMHREAIPQEQRPTLEELIAEFKQQAADPNANRRRYDDLLEQICLYVYTCASLTPPEQEALSSLPRKNKLPIASAIALSFSYIWDKSKVTFLLRELAAEQSSFDYRVRLVWALMLAGNNHPNLFLFCREELAPLIKQANEPFPLGKIHAAIAQYVAVELKSEEFVHSYMDDIRTLAQDIAADHPEFYAKHPLDFFSGYEHLLPQNQEEESSEDPQEDEDEDETVTHYRAALKQVMQWEQEGLDLAYSGLKDLKTGAFFAKRFNWFLPFDPRHSSLGNPDSSIMQTVLSKLLSHSLCANDMYSLFQNNFLARGIGSKVEEQMPGMLEELAPETLQQEEPENNLATAARFYMQDLYRFYTLYAPTKHSIADTPLHDIDLLNPIKGLEQVLADEAEGYLPAVQILGELPFPYASLQAAQVMSNVLRIKGSTNPRVYFALGEAEADYIAKRDRMRKGFTPEDFSAPEDDLDLLRADNEERYLDLAVQHYTIATILDPDNVLYLEGLGGAQELSGEISAAVESYLKVVDKDPAQTELLLHIAQLYEERREYTKALNLLFRYQVTATQNEHQVYPLIARLYLRQRNIEKAYEITELIPPAIRNSIGNEYLRYSWMDEYLHPAVIPVLVCIAADKPARALDYITCKEEPKTHSSRTEPLPYGIKQLSFEESFDHPYVQELAREAEVDMNICRLLLARAAE